MSDTSPQSTKKKSRDRSSSADKNITRVRSSSNASTNGTTINPTAPTYATHNPVTSNSEEMQPLLRKVQTLRLSRLSLVMNCTCFLSIIVLIVAFTILGISISTFTYTIIFPYHNYFVMELNADDSSAIASGVAVSTIGGQIRAGSGFEFIYQRVTDTKLPSYPLQVQTFSFFPNNPK
jgi:hypothetical protein